MSKQYKVNMNIDVSKATPNGGFILKPLPKDAKPGTDNERRTGAEVFAFLTSAAINGGNPKCGFHALKGFRQAVRLVDKAVATGELIANKTDLQVIKNSIDANPHWPNTDEMFDVLASIIDAVEKAEIVEPVPV